MHKHFVIDTFALTTDTYFLLYFNSIQWFQNTSENTGTNSSICHETLRKILIMYFEIHILSKYP